MNEIVLIGRLAADPEARYTKTSKPVTTFTIAVNRYDTGHCESESIRNVRCKTIS